MTGFQVLFRSVVSTISGVLLVFVTACATSPQSTNRNAATPAPVVAAPATPAPATAPATSPAEPEPPAPPAVSSSPATSNKTALEPSIAPTPPPTKPSYATIRGSQETSILLDNYTAFIIAVDGRKVAAGRNGWDSVIEIKVGRHILEVEFNRGVFFARTKLELDATAKVNYELKYTTDAELFGHNSYCDFWIVDRATDQAVTAIKKASVEKMPEVRQPSSLP